VGDGPGTTATGLLVGAGNSKMTCPSGDKKAETTIAVSQRLFSAAGVIAHFVYSSRWIKPSRTSLMLDGLKQHAPGNSYNKFPFRHLKTTTVVFCDMHAQQLKVLPTSDSTKQGYHVSAWQSLFWSPCGWDKYQPVDLPFR
jgi:hypothetical protein